MTVGAIILAAGSSTRMGGADKLLAPLAGRPVLAHSLAVFAAHEQIQSLVVVASASNLEAVRTLAAKSSQTKVVLGGRRRRDSVLNGLNAVGGCEYIVVHDGARPLVTRSLIDSAIEGAREVGAALCASPVADTVKRAGASGLVQETVAREGLWLAQTPQAFRTDLLRQAHAASDVDATDDAALVELTGQPVTLVEGSQSNIKITTPGDLALAEALIASRGYTASGGEPAAQC